MMEEARDMTTNRRMMPRKPVALRAVAVPHEGAMLDAFISNLSYEGCDIECTPLPQRGEQVELRVSRLGIIKAEVLWTRGGRAGCRFLG